MVTSCDLFFLFFGGGGGVNTSRQEVDRNWVEVIMGMVEQREEQHMQVNGAILSTGNMRDNAMWVRDVVDSDKVGTTVNMMLGRTESSVKVQ